MFSPGEHFLRMTEGCLAAAKAACLNNLIFTINVVPLWTKKRLELGAELQAAVLLARLREMDDGLIVHCLILSLL